MRRAVDSLRLVTPGVVAVSLLLGVVGCADPGSENTPPAADDQATTTGAGMPPHGPGAVLTPADQAVTVELAVGQEATIQLAPPWQDQSVQVEDPGVVELVPVDHFTDPGYAEYTLVGLAPGRTTVTAEAPQHAEAAPETEDWILQVTVID